MSTFHVAVDHIDPDTLDLTTTYYGTCDQAHVDEVRAIADLDDSERWVKDHPRLDGAFMVLRDDGDLDVYVPTDAPEYRVYAPDPGPKDIDPEDLPRGASGPAYITGAIRLGSQSIGGAMDTPGNPPRYTWHTTESPAGKAYFYSIAAYLIRVGAEPQVVYDPESDLLGQFGPLTQSGRALRNDGSRRTNREGKVNIQVEVLARARTPWTKDFDPAKKPNYRKLLAAGRAHGIPDVWPAGRPGATAGSAKRDRSTWQTKGGHYGHCHVPNNDHWDPGGIDVSIVPGKPTGGSSDPTPGGGSSTGTGVYTVRKGDTLSAIAKRYKTTVAKLTALNALRDADELDVGQKLKVPSTTAPAPSVPRYEPFPGSSFFHGGRHSPIITALGRRLVELGFGEYYKSGPGPNWTNADKRAVAAFQRSVPELAGDADGIPGPKTWAALKIPNS